MARALFEFQCDEKHKLASKAFGRNIVPALFDGEMMIFKYS